MYYTTPVVEADIVIGPMDVEMDYPLANAEAGEGNGNDDNNDGADEDANDVPAAATVPTTTRSGRTVRPPQRYIEEVGAHIYDYTEIAAKAANYKPTLTAAESKYYAVMKGFS